MKIAAETVQCSRGPWLIPSVAEEGAAWAGKGGVSARVRRLPVVLHGGRDELPFRTHWAGCVRPQNLQAAAACLNAGDSMLIVFGIPVMSPPLFCSSL
jgi:hypothetical protein